MLERMSSLGTAIIAAGKIRVIKKKNLGLNDTKQHKEREIPHQGQAEAPCSGHLPSQNHLSEALCQYAGYDHMLPSASTCWSSRKNPSNFLQAAATSCVNMLA